MRINIKNLLLLFVTCGLIAPEPETWGQVVKSEVKPSSLDLGSDDAPTGGEIRKFVCAIDANGFKCELDLFIRSNIMVNEGESYEQFAELYGQYPASQIFCNRVNDGLQLSPNPLSPSIITMVVDGSKGIYPLISLSDNAETVVAYILDPKFIALIKRRMKEAIELRCMRILPVKIDIESSIIDSFREVDRKIRDTNDPQKEYGSFFWGVPFYRIRNRHGDVFTKLARILPAANEQIKRQLYHTLMILGSVLLYKTKPETMYSWISRHLGLSLVEQDFQLIPGLYMRSETLLPLVYIYLNSQSDRQDMMSFLTTIQNNCLESLRTKVT